MPIHCCSQGREIGTISSLGRPILIVRSIDFPGFSVPLNGNPWGCGQTILKVDQVNDGSRQGSKSINKQAAKKS